MKTLAQPKYIGDSKMFEYEKFYQECRQYNRPFVKARTNPVTADSACSLVTLDMMPCNYRLSVSVMTNIRRLAKDEITSVAAISGYTSAGFEITDEHAWFDGVMTGHVDVFCCSLYDMACKSCVN